MEKCVLILNVIRNADLLQVRNKSVQRKVGKMLVQTKCQQLEADRGTSLQTHERIKQCIAVLSSGDTHHHLVSVFNQIEIRNRLGAKSDQALLEFSVFKR